MPRKVIIMGAAGRDFHNFNVFFKNNSNYNVVAFTASQIPNISNRIYPPKLAGKLYPNGIPIYSENELEKLIKKFKADLVVLAYSDLKFEEVMEKASRVMAAGSSFMLLGPRDTMLRSLKPIIAICATRTGAGKSTTTRKISEILKKKGIKHVIVRHPMPYGNLEKQEVQRFEKLEDLDKNECTIEEREEYEQHIKRGIVVYAGVDYQKILNLAEKESDLIIWDGGNNDFPFYTPDLMITVTDPLRPGDEVLSYPGQINLRLANVIIINKINVAPEKNVNIVLSNIRKYNPKAIIIKASSEVEVDRPGLIKDKKVLVVEDGPTVTHGDLGYGAGYIAAIKYRAKEIVKPKKYAKGSLKNAYSKYSQLKDVLPAIGYGKAQIKELEATINSIDCDSIILGTPTDISRFMKINKPVVHVRYEIKEVEGPKLNKIIDDFLTGKKL